MKKLFPKFLFSLLCIGTFLSIKPLGNILYAQEFKMDNLSGVNADDLSDQQLNDLLSTYKNTGGDIAHLDEYLLNRGMASEEVTKVLTRVQTLNQQSQTPLAQGNNLGTTGINAVGEDKGEQDLTKVPSKSDMIDTLPIFGTAYFNGSSATYTPNPNRPIPANYIIGPGDALLINIYGNSVVSWNLTVTPEGYILIPGIGKVYVGSKTFDNAKSLIQSKLISNNIAIGKGSEMSLSLTNLRSVQISINGEVKHPGTYMVSSVSTVFNALAAAGGPSLMGSLRSVKVIRDGRLYTTVDVYEFLLLGDKGKDVRLEDGDVIQIPVYQSRVSITGSIKRPGYYEMLPGESLKDLIYFAGGFKSQAYTQDIKAIRLTGTEKRMEDINQSQYEEFTPLNGDQYFVDNSLDRFENRITINGAVFRPGDFELTAGMTLTDLIKKSGGLKEDAYMDRGYLTRLNPDNTTKIISFNVKDAAQGKGEPIPLQREDIITIPSIFDLRDNYTVTISGQVRKPGTFPYSDSLTIEDLIIEAGGFTKFANLEKVVVARRIYTANPKDATSDYVKLITIDIDSNLSLTKNKHPLKPYDLVSIFGLPGSRAPGSVQIQGEVVYPGRYAIINRAERLSDLVKRSEGLTTYADLSGATLIRKGDGKVGINLKKILQKPGGREDLILQDSDILVIPGLQQTVSVHGQVFSPMSIIYKSSKINYYIDRSGGYNSDALRRKVYVVYANGEQRSTRNFLFFRSHPKVMPGSNIIIPQKIRRDSGMSAQAWIGLGTSLGSLAAIVLAILRQ